MSKRKTIDVEYIKKYANDRLRESKDDMVGFRSGVMVMIEQILHETGNYRGFGYLDKQDMVGTTNKSVGIRRDVPAEQKFDDTDNTRVYYY